jgi:hypothetical protein
MEEERKKITGCLEAIGFNVSGDSAGLEIPLTKMQPGPCELVLSLYYYWHLTAV